MSLFAKSPATVIFVVVDSVPAVMVKSPKILISLVITFTVPALFITTLLKS